MLLQFETYLAIVTDCEMLDGISADHDGRGYGVCIGRQPPLTGLGPGPPRACQIVGILGTLFHCARTHGTQLANRRSINRLQ
jgi:hypothetical protein